ncbi:hypothetical protein [Archaeoglobus fulgidus]|uniref:hypothetical protein n=1 Tax=Archaeoglobus fulgidus TaxID=2234 RepID=UPI000A750333|nr:hypothetical protein [Archaeoglobus fulgidus]
MTTRNRHLTTAQKAEKVTEVENFPPREDSDNEKGKVRDIVAKKAREEGLQISDKTVKKAKKILEVAEKDPETCF